MIIDPHLALSEEQFARIGRIHVTWAAVEKFVQHIIARLSFASDWPTGALTDNLIFDHRLSAIDTLVEIHRKQLGCRLVEKGLCDEIEQLKKDLKNLRPMRNRLAHWVMWRSGNEIVAARFATRTASPAREDLVSYTVTDLDAHIVAIMARAETAQKVLNDLPKQPDPFDRIQPRK